MLDFFDHYTSLFKYLNERQGRHSNVLRSQGITPGKLDYCSLTKDVKSVITDHLFNESAILRQRRLKPKLSDFATLTQIGQGAFGEIHLVRHKPTNQICALKTIPKLHIQRKDQRLQILTERDILSTTKYPHLVKLMYSFQDKHTLYLAMEYMPGGDLRTFLNSNMPLALREIKFYALEMVFAVSSVHELGYIHRDVKPENFLIDAYGHLKLTDFGLACGNLSKQRIFSLQAQFTRDSQNFGLDTSSPSQQHLNPLSAPAGTTDAPVWSEEAVGSVEYMAIEVIQHQPYSSSVDFWSLGCLFYEMLVGKTPFHGNPDMIVKWPLILKNCAAQYVRPFNHHNSAKSESSDSIHQSTFLDNIGFGNSMPIRNSSDYSTAEEVIADGYIDEVSWDLITHLITSQNRRYKTSSEILQHPFFMTMSHEYRVTPPFIPTLDHEADCKYFDDFESPDIQNMYVDIIMHRKKVESKLAQDPEAKHKFQQKYLGFTFRRTL